MNKRPVEVTGITVFPPYKGYMVILKEREGKRYLPIFIGIPEAHHISLLLQNIKHVRPLTYDLFHNLINLAGGRVDEVTVTDLRDDTFYAEIDYRIRETVKRVDARPSDAIALAIRFKAPIYVSNTVMDKAGMIGEITTIPTSVDDRRRELNKQLEESVESEAYEEAARIRDQIKDLEEQHRSS
jgi:bifunctional DNase/RNase